MELTFTMMLVAVVNVVVTGVMVQVFTAIDTVLAELPEAFVAVTV